MDANTPLCTCPPGHAADILGLPKTHPFLDYLQQNIVGVYHQCRQGDQYTTEEILSVASGEIDNEYLFFAFCQYGSARRYIAALSSVDDEGINKITNISLRLMKRLAGPVLIRGCTFCFILRAHTRRTFIQRLEACQRFWVFHTPSHFIGNIL